MERPVPDRTGVFGEMAAIQAQLAQILEENRALREQQQRQQDQTALLTRLAESMTELARKSKREEVRRLLVDTEEHLFRKWVRSVTNLVVSIFGKEFEKVLDWCLDQDGPDDISVDEVEAKHGEPDSVWPDNFLPLPMVKLRTW